MRWSIRPVELGHGYPFRATAAGGMHEIDCCNFLFSILKKREVITIRIVGGKRAGEVVSIYHQPCVRTCVGSSGMCDSMVSFGGGRVGG